MDDPLLSEQQTSIPGILQSLTMQDNLLIKLNAIDTILTAVDDDIAKKVNAQGIKRFLHRTYLDDTTFMRRIKMYAKMAEHTELAIEYYGQDFISHPEYFFDEEFEALLADLNKRLNKIIGLLLKEYQQGDKIEF